MTIGAQSFPTPRLTVAEFLTEAMKESESTDAQPAKQLELDDVRQVVQLRDGSLRMPIQNVDRYAWVFMVEPTHLLLLALSEYFPEVYQALMIAGGSLVTPNEWETLQDIREALGYRDLPLRLIHGNASGGPILFGVRAPA